MTPLQRLRDQMAALQIESLLVTDPTNVGWLTGFTGSFGQVVVTPANARFLTDSRYTVQAQSEVREMPVASFSAPDTSMGFLQRQLADLGLSRLHFEASFVSVAQFQDWQQNLAAVHLEPATSVFESLRMVKSADEIERIRQVCGIADAAFDHVRRLMQPGISEFDILMDLELFFRRQGGVAAFDIIVASGERSALPHGRASERILQRGDFVTLDFGCRKDQYNSDLTRTVVLGEPTERQREVYDQVLKAQMTAIDAIRPGVPAAEVDALARRILDEKQLAQYFGHGLGHGLGRLVHDAGRLNATSTDVFAPGQVWTIEPGVYIEGWGGVRIEDDIVVTDTGVEVLTHAPKDLLVLPER